MNKNGLIKCAQQTYLAKQLMVKVAKRAMRKQAGIADMLGRGADRASKFLGASTPTMSAEAKQQLLNYLSHGAAGAAVGAGVGAIADENSLRGALLGAGGGAALGAGGLGASKGIGALLRKGKEGGRLRRAGEAIDGYNPLGTLAKKRVQRMRTPAGAAESASSVNYEDMPAT